MRARVLSAILLGLSVVLAGPIKGACAQPFGPPAYRDPRDGVQPLDRLLPGIRRSHPGDFYDADGPTIGPDGDPHYHLKWMTPDGRIIWYDANARNGRVLRASPGRDNFDARPAPPPGFRRPYAPGGFAPGYSYGPRYAPQFTRPFGRGGGGGRWRH
jgi:hypothetical protein